MFRFDRRSLARCRPAALLAVATLSACAVPQRLLPPSMRSAPPSANAVTANLPPPAPPNAAPSPPPRAASAPVPTAAAGVAPAPAAPTAVASPIRPMAPVVVTPLPSPTVPSAIAARFPEPSVSLATPAFEPGRTSFTSNGELRAIVHGIERGASLAEHATDVAVVSLGISQAGEPIEALAFTRPPAAPAVAGSAPTRRPAVVLLAGQHGDEPAGTEALVVVAQELAAGRLASVLDRIDVVVLPRANPDGAAAFTRGAADGTDVNRDHIVLKTPEAQAIAKLLVQVAPVVVLDLHEYPVTPAFTARFGGVQRFDALFQYATVANVAPFVTKAAEEWFRVPLLAGLRSAGMSVDWYATMSSDPADRTLTMGSVGPQVGRNAAGLRNAVSLLVETRGGGMGRVDLKRRVQTHVVATLNVLASAARHADDLVKLRQFVDRETASFACRGEVVLDAAPTPSEYATSVLDPVTGDVRRLTVAWQSALQLRPLKSRPRPCGYWLAQGETDAVRRLRLLGVDVQQLDELGELRGEGYREIGREPADGESASAGGASRLKVQTLPALLDVAAGSYYVSLEQPLAHLAIVALEPESPASYAAHGVVAEVANEARVLARPVARMTGVP